MPSIGDSILRRMYALSKEIEAGVSPVSILQAVCVTAL
jgi:hypothetical protein